MIENITFLGREFSIYQIMATVGVLLTGVYACHRARRRGMDDNTMILFLLWAGGGVLLGGHLLYALTQAAQWTRLTGSSSWREFFIAVYSIFGGSVFYGGLLGGVATGVWYLHRKQEALGGYGDIMAAGVPLFHLFGRLGCFFSGCCYGVPCAFGVTYRHALIAQANGISRFPVQLVEALLNLALFLVMDRLGRKNRYSGRLFWLYLLCYASGRFLLEFLRGDTYRGFLWGLSTSQWISIFLFSAALPVLLRRGKPTAPVKTREDGANR